MIWLKILCDLSRESFGNVVFVRRQNPRPGDRSLDIADPRFRKTARTSKCFSMKNSQNLKIFFNEKQPESQNVFQWKTTRTSKCFSMKNNKALTLFPPLSASAQQRRNWLFFLQSAQCLLKFAARRKTFQPWTFWGSLWANYSNVENNQTQRFDNLLLSIIEKWTSRPVEKIVGLQMSQAF